MRDPAVFDTLTIKSNTFVMLKGYAFRFKKEAADYVSEPDFVPFVWRCQDKEDDGKGLEDRNRDGADGLDAAKSVEEDTPMPQVQSATGPGTSSLGLFDYAVTPINPNPQTPRGKEIVAQLLRGSSPPAMALSSTTSVSEGTGGGGAALQVLGPVPPPDSLGSASVPATAQAGPRVAQEDVVQAVPILDLQCSAGSGGAHGCDAPVGTTVVPQPTSTPAVSPLGSPVSGGFLHQPGLPLCRRL